MDTAYESGFGILEDDLLELEDDTEEDETFDGEVDPESFDDDDDQGFDPEDFDSEEEEE